MWTIMAAALFIGTEAPQSVTVTTADGKKVTVNADGGFSLDDGRTITLSADGAIQVTRRPKTSEPGRKYDVNLGPGARGVQFGNGNAQVNAF